MQSNNIPHPPPLPFPYLSLKYTAEPSETPIQTTAKIDYCVYSNNSWIPTNICSDCKLNFDLNRNMFILPDFDYGKISDNCFTWCITIYCPDIDIYYSCPISTVIDHLNSIPENIKKHLIINQLIH